MSWWNFSWRCVDKPKFYIKNNFLVEQLINWKKGSFVNVTKILARSMYIDACLGIYGSLIFLGFDSEEEDLSEKSEFERGNKYDSSDHYTPVNQEKLIPSSRSQYLKDSTDKQKKEDKEKGYVKNNSFVLVCILSKSICYAVLITILICWMHGVWYKWV